MALKYKIRECMVLRGYGVQWLDQSLNMFAEQSRRPDDWRYRVISVLKKIRDFQTLHLATDQAVLAHGWCTFANYSSTWLRKMLLSS